MEMNKDNPFHGLSHEDYLKKIGITKLRTIISSKTWENGDPYKHAEAIEAVRRFDAARAEKLLAVKDEREERALEIASDANSIARQALSTSRAANKIAISAAILATIATICTAIITYMYTSNKELTQAQETRAEQTKKNINSAENCGNKIFFIKPNIIGTGLDVMALWDRIKT